MKTPIPTEGRVELRVEWGGSEARAASVCSRRPQPQSLLRGLSLEQVCAVIPRLYTLCGDAQTVAVEALRTLLRTGEPDVVSRQDWAERVRLEIIREHLWRLGLDWPGAIGTAPQPTRVRELLASRTQFAVDRAAARSWAAGTLQELVGSPVEPWIRELDPQPFARWLRAAPTALARLLAQLRPRLSGLGRSQAPLFRGTDLGSLVRDVLPRLQTDPDFHWRPDWNGQVFEMGPLARNRDQPLIQALLAESGSPDSWLRVVARVLELVQALQSLAAGQPAGPAMAWHREPREAVVALEMARGVLLHWARADGNGVAAYRIVAPTEWNFHPEGPARQGLLQLQRADEQQVRERVKLQVMALDPCVQYELEIADA